MRQLLISGLIVLATIVSASASDRYPVKKRYVNQTGQVMTIGEAPQVTAYAPVPRARALPAIQIVPVAAIPTIVRPAPRLVTAQSGATRDRLFGGVNVDPANWPSGRKCCRPGEPYFNEEPNS
jgi:hypothetical protein